MIDPNYLVHVGMECGVALLPCTIPLCQAALHSFSDRLLQMSVVIAQYSFRTILKASDITYGFRVVTDADRQSLGVAYYCFDPSADALHTVGQDTSNSSRKRSHTECESRDSGDEGDSSFCSVSNVSTESWSSSGSGDTSQSDVGIDDAVESAIGEEEVYANRFANLDSSKISSADEALASRENCTIQEGPPADRNINCNRFPVAQIICSFNCTFQTSLELDETALTVLGDILQTQFELSLMGSPSAICAKYDKMLVSIKEANYMLMLLAKIDGLLPPKSTEITKIDTPAASTDKSISTSTISNVTATSHASAFSSFTSYTDQKHRVAFDLDDSIISSNKSLQSDVIIEPSVDDPKLESSMACDRSFGVTPFYSKRMGEERQALMTADAHADFYNAFEDLASTPYITEYLNKQDQVQKRDQGALWVERGSSGTDDIPAFCFDALSPIMVPEPVSPSSPLPKRPKGLN